MKNKFRLLFFLIGLAGFILLIIQTNPGSEDWQKLVTPELPLLLVALLLLWAFIYLIHTNVYRVIIGEDSVSLSLPSLFSICFSGFALNEVTPLGIVGGEPFRIMSLKNHIGLEKAASVSLTFSILYAIGHVLLWSTGIILYLAIGCPGEPLTTGALVVCLIILLLVCFAFFNKNNTGIVLPFLGFLARVPIIGKPAASYIEKKRLQLEQIDSNYVLFRREKKRFLRSVLLEYAARLLESAEYFIIFKYLGTPVSIVGGILIYSMASLLGNLLFFIPMQAGTREGGMAIAVEWLGIEPATGMIGGLIFRMRYLICILAGLICILVCKGKTDTKKKPQT